jgi:hypothetical protein
MSAFSRFPRSFSVPVVAALAACAIDAQAFVLSSGNSSVNIDSSTQMGMNSWNVDGQNQLYQQWFWYWTGSMTSEKSIDTISAPVITLNSPSQATSTYTGSGFTLSVIYDLLGGAAGSGQSVINETITINNTSGSALGFRFFQYSDYNLGGVDQDVVQIQPGFGYALVTSGALSLGETVVSPSANNGEVAPYDQTLLKLNNGAVDTLNGNLGPSAAGDYTFAFQWDFTIAPNSSVILSKVKSLQVQVVPEPTSAVLGMLGIGLLLGRRFIKK